MPRVPFSYLGAMLVLFGACSEPGSPVRPSADPGGSDHASSQQPSAANTDAAASDSHRHGRIIHTLTGSAVHNPDFGSLGHATYRETVTAILYEDGSTSGTSVIDGDFSGYALGFARFTTTIDCLSVDGNVAWYTGAVTESNNSALAPVGTAAVGQFVDSGRVDQVHSGPLVAFTAPGTTCRKHPSLPLFPTSNGTYVVR
jgi:hypothetical protein